jgi:para-aminobenzoate synthetase/4-amino-4-deoxychorismate lyase
LDNCFVLLDDCHATESRPSSRLFTGLVKQHMCTDPTTLDAFWSQVETDQAQGLHAAVLVDYEWGAKLLGAGTRSLTEGDSSALRVLLFNQCTQLAAAAVDDWLAEQDGGGAPSCAGVVDWMPSVTQTEFDCGVAKILDLIRAGETYQVNYSYRMHGAQYGSPIGLYRRLRALQPVAFGALAALPVSDFGTSSANLRWVLSCSPELFVRNDQGHLTTRPMKGTAPRAATAPADAQMSYWLGTDPKNRAENVMIVDLLRNDLGRISTTGSVRVPRLFSVETYATVHQMTSTVESELRADLRFPDVLRALFPCGSITGTPKIHTMNCIAALESTPRGLYCGAIGWVNAPAAGAHCGDFCLSVAIRTLTLGNLDHATRPATLGVGGGIVLDSEQHSEFDETRVKARFLTQVDPGFTLFETVLVRKGKPCKLALHQARIAASARALGFRLDPAQFAHQLIQYAGLLCANTDHRVRVDLSHDGSMRIAHAALDPLPNVPVRLVWADHPVDPTEVALLQHKTSLRGSYDRAMAAAMAKGAFDAVFVNSAGQVTEGARSNLLVRIDGRWCTPALACGVLPGVMRQRVLHRFSSVAQTVLGVDDVARAEQLVVCNSLRGLLTAHPLGLP